MKVKKKSSGTKRKSAKRPATGRRTATRRAVALRRRPSTIEAKRKRTVAELAPRKKSVPRKIRLQIPPILFEGDRPTPPKLSGPGEKFALGESSDSPAHVIATETAELPEAYGTGRLFVTTRDPHWLYAHWDFTREQQRRYNAQSAHGHLVLRTYVGAPEGQAVSEIHVHPESRHWFAHVERAATEYVAELGYYRHGHQWTRLATSAATSTPPDTLSPDRTVSFATIPVETPFEKLRAMAKQAALENVPLVQALEELRQRSAAEPSSPTAESSTWTPERERALAEIIRTDTSPCAWMDSLEIPELMRGQEPDKEQISSPGAGESGLYSWPASAGENISSPLGRPPPEAKGFWFNVNAELVIYGATERDATVVIGGRKITLRPDGTFSFRFALPDGQYELAVVAVSADEVDGRAADLKFTRATEFAGNVGTHPQDPALEPPTPDNVR